MREINKISEALFEKIRDRFEDVSLGDDKARATQEPEDARFFNFDYVVDDHNYGNITISLIDENSLKVYFSKNISHELQGEERQTWYAFLRELREFAKRNLLSFEPRDITRSTLKHRDLQQVSKADSTYSKDEVVAESRMWGSMNRSYEDFGPVRIKVLHSKPIVDETNGARSRNIDAVFVENDQGERFRMPFNSLVGSRAMARHISAGGTPSDEFGCHIREMVEEMLTLRPFIHSMRHRQFEDANTNEMLESAFEYHSLLKNTLKKMKGKRGYNEYKESYQPALIETDDFDQDEVRDKFVKKVFPNKLEAALPIVHKAYNMKKQNENAYLQQFESWATNVAEEWDDSEDAQQWGEEPINVDDLADLFGEELPLGVDAVNAINAISGVINSNELEDVLLHASQQDPQADARDIILGWLESNVPAVFQELQNEISESGTGDTPIDQMSRVELLDYLGVSPEEVMTVSDDELRAAANERAESLPEGTYGATGMDEPNVYEEYCDACDRTADKCVCEDHDDDDQVDAVQSAIIHRITRQHLDMLQKYGPEEIMNASRAVAEWTVPVSEIGSSDVSAWVKQTLDQLGREHNIDEGKMKDIAIDLEQLTDEQFQAKYGKTKQEVESALSEGLTGLQKLGAGAALVGALAGNAYMGQKSIDNDPYVQKLEQQYQQVLQASDQAYAQGDMTKVKQLDAFKGKLENAIEDAKASAELGVGSEEEGLREMKRLAGL